MATTQDWSLGEIRSLATKAAKGAGFPWGLADEAGLAVHWLQAREISGAEALANYLVWREANPNEDACPLRIGCNICDLETWETQVLERIAQPILLIPFIAAAFSERPVLLKTENASALFNERSVEFDQFPALLQSGIQSCALSFSESEPEESYCVTRVPASAADAVTTLNEFAFRSYAPATEESRLAGAGAGLNDND